VSFQTFDHDDLHEQASKKEDFDENFHEIETMDNVFFNPNMPS
jgi:hypothetical protein